MRCGRAVLFAVLLIPLSGSAQVDPQPDGVGLYFDTAATQVSATTSADWQPIDAYLVVTNASDHSDLVFFHGHYAIQPPDLGGTFTSQSCHIVFSAGDLNLSCQPALPWSPVILLGTLRIWVPTPETCVLLFITPGEGGLYYRVAPPPAPSIPLTPSSGSFTLPVATINASPPIRDAESTWGSIKGLYESPNNP